MESIEVQTAFAAIEESIVRYKAEGKKMFATSSFQTHSIPLLHIISRVDNSIPIYFINTGFHFAETLNFRDEIGKLFNLNIVDLHSITPKNLQRDGKGNFYFTSDPNYCCFLNKTQPMEPVLAEKDIWINGIRADQNANRRNMKIEQPAPNNSMRYHPMLHWDNKMVFGYKSAHNLPSHPLEAKGYLSIGCEPCTRKFDFENNRDGRWFGMKKTECGLHTDLATK